MKEEKYTVESILNAIKQSEYKINLSHGHLNIIGIRNTNLYNNNKFNDKICMIVNVNNNIKYFELPATTKSSIDGIVDPSKFGCHYILPCGVYKKMIKLSGQGNIIQNSPVILSAYNCKKEIDLVNESNSFVSCEYETVKGIYIDKIGYLSIAKKPSEIACQYVKRYVDLNLIISYAIFQNRVIKNRLFDYILMQDINGNIVFTNKIYGG